MDLTRFKECAAAYGAERRRWPTRELALYDRFAETPAGAAILAEAERTDRFLAGFEVAAPEEALVEAISRRPADAKRGGIARVARRRSLWWQVTAFAASAVLGFALGFAQVADDPAEDVVAQFLLGPAGFRESGL
jgi:hypothetical protein